MRNIDCDIVVVGAGPAGSLAARTAAENGAITLLLEEHPRVGHPIYCAEGLSLGGLKEAGVDPKPPVVCQEITKARVFAPDKNFVELTSTDWKGYTLNREVFDNLLAEKATEAGADLLTSTKATDLIYEDGVVVGVKAVSGEEHLEIKARIVIGADGHASIIRRKAGLGEWFPDVVTCAQYRLGDLELEEPETNEFYLGRGVSPGGYAWVFPKSADVANVGLGVRKIHTESPIKYLKRFIANDPRFKDAEIQLVNGGICPVSGVLDKTVSDGLMLTGDSAGQLIPATGAGIHSGLASGKMAGEVAAKAVEEGNVSTGRLSEYEKRFDIYWGERIRNSRKVVEMLDKFSDENLNILAKVMTHEDILNLANGTSVARTLTRIVARSPKGIINLMSAYLKQ
jgi:digeranylgeranylglycerophospholipid reductase